MQDYSKICEGLVAWRRSNLLKVVWSTLCQVLSSCFIFVTSKTACPWLRPNWKKKQKMSQGVWRGHKPPNASTTARLPLEGMFDSDHVFSHQRACSRLLEIARDVDNTLGPKSSWHVAPWSIFMLVIVCEVQLRGARYGLTGVLEWRSAWGNYNFARDCPRLLEILLEININICNCLYSCLVHFDSIWSFCFTGVVTYLQCLCAQTWICPRMLSRFCTGNCHLLEIARDCSRLIFCVQLAITSMFPTSQWLLHTIRLSCMPCQFSSATS